MKNPKGVSCILAFLLAIFVCTITGEAGLSGSAAFDDATTEAPPEQTTERFPQVTPLDCGGIILLSRDMETLVGYKYNEYYLNDEKCLWTVTTRADYNNEKILVELTLISDELRYNADYVHVLALDMTDGGGTSIKATRLLGEEAIKISPDFAFLSFTSGPSGLGTRRGFVVKLKLSYEGRYVQRTVLSYSSSEGQVHYGNPYGNLDRVSIVVNPPVTSDDTIYFEVDWTDIQIGGPDCAYDRLNIYKIVYADQPTHLKMFCGRYDVATKFTAREPFIAFFSSSSFDSDYRGFSISWNVTRK